MPGPVQLSGHALNLPPGLRLLFRRARQLYRRHSLFNSPRHRVHVHYPCAVQVCLGCHQGRRRRRRRNWQRGSGSDRPRDFLHRHVRDAFHLGGQWRPRWRHAPDRLRRQRGLRERNRGRRHRARHRSGWRRRRISWQRFSRLRGRRGRPPVSRRERRVLGRPRWVGRHEYERGELRALQRRPPLLWLPRLGGRGSVHVISVMRLYWRIRRILYKRPQCSGRWLRRRRPGRVRRVRRRINRRRRGGRRLLRRRGR